MVKDSEEHKHDTNKKCSKTDNYSGVEIQGEETREMGGTLSG